MIDFYLTPSSVSHTANWFLVLLLSGYLFLAWFKRRIFGGELFFLTAFFVVFSVCEMLFWLDTALLPQVRLFVVYLENPVLALALLLMLQFAYRVPQLMPNTLWERRGVLLLSGGYVLHEFWVMIERFDALRLGYVSYRTAQSDYFLVVIQLLLPIAFFRQGVLADKRPIAAWRKILSMGGGVGACAVRAFGLLYMFLLMLGVTNVLRGDSRVSAMVYNIVVSVGFLLATWLFALIYINFRLETTSFLIKLSGTILLALLIFWSVTGWVLAPAHSDTFLPEIEDYRTLRFVPDGEGGYTILGAGFRFDENLGERMSVTSRGDGRNAAVEFPFPLFGKGYDTVYVTSVGMLQMGTPLYHPNLQNGYGHTAAIFPLLVDLEPEWGGGVYTRIDSDRLVVTWHELHALYAYDQVYTFQAVLYRDGSFDLTYNGLPDPIVYLADASPSSSAWVRGVTSGNGLPEVRTGALLPGDSIHATGLLQDFYLDFRIYLHILMQPLTLMLVISSVLLLLITPFLLRRAVIQPLNYLLMGVRKIESGDLSVQVPVVGQDEIGFLANAFNQMAAQQNILVSTLETRVAERTKALSEANTRLSAEIRAIQAAQNQILSQQRQLAILDERMRMSRELHDGLAQSIGFIVVQSETVQEFLRTKSLEPAAESVDGIGRVAKQAHADLRHFILGLRSEMSMSENFLEALRTYIAHTEQESGLQLNLSVPEFSELYNLNLAVEEQILHIVQEALTNIRKHAKATQVEILVECDRQMFRLSILDDGIGFEKAISASVNANEHFGLQMMKERAKLIGGELEVRTQIGRGTKILLRVPLFQVTADVSETGQAKRLPRVLLADDSPLFLDGLHNLLMARGIPVVGVAYNGIEVQRKVALLRPDVIVMDLFMPECDGVEATHAIKLEYPEIKIVMLTTSEDRAHLLAALQAGASGFLLKGSDANTFCASLIKLAEGETILSPQMISVLMKSYLEPAQTGTPFPLLSERQQEIMDLVTQGLTYREIGSRLYLSEKTIKYHMAQILDRLQVKNRTEAVARLSQQHSR